MILRPPFVFVVAAALIDGEGRVLLAKRPEGKAMGGLWEFPGGKVHDGETPDEAVIRELREELGIDVVPGSLSPGGFTSHAYEDFHLFMPLYICREWIGTPEAIEHAALEWAVPGELSAFEMPDADVPLVGQLKRLL